MEKYIFTDLACEKRDKYGQNITKISERIRRTVTIDAENNDTTEYITYHTPKLWLLTDDEFFCLKKELTSTLCGILNKIVGDKKFRSVLVVGLGNPYLTSDALGAETIRGISVMCDSSYNATAKRGRYTVSAFIPDVYGNTGIDTVSAVRAYVNIVKPDAVIAVDAMRARACERLAATVQLSNSGLVPGGGTGQNGRALCFDTLGVPVISIGIPTVVSSSTMICDALRLCDIDINNEKLNSLLENGLNFFVSPTEADVLTKTAAVLLSAAINEALS